MTIRYRPFVAGIILTTLTVALFAWREGLSLYILGVR